MFELSLLAKATVVLAAALSATRLLRRTRASVRALLLAGAFGALLALPLAPGLIPARTIEVALPYDMPVAVVETSVPLTVDAPMTAAAQPARRPPLSVPSLLRGLWALGALVFFVRLLLALRRLAVMRRSGLPWVEGSALLRRLGGPARVDLFVHEELRAPITCGAWRPAVGLPADAATWPEPSLRHALLHELSHVRRHDWAIHIAAQVTCALYWFHPLAWIAAREWCLDAERACDDAVLAEAERTAYAEQLVELARRFPSRGPAAVLSMATRSDLSTRVRAILDPRQSRGRAGVVCGVGVTAAAMVMTILLSPLKVVAVQSPAAPQTGPKPAFEVASIKPNTGSTPGQRIQQLGNRFVATNVTTRDLIATAYAISLSEQLSGGPGWMASERYDIEAKPPGNATWPEQRVMLQQLLADRFQLVLRRESRPVPVFGLTRGNTLRLKPAAECPETRPDCSGFTTGPGVILARRVSLARLAGILSGARTGRRVVDQTGLDELYDFELRWTPDPGQLPTGPAPDDAPPVDPTGPSLFTAIDEQLGLKLVSSTGSIEHFVVERVERPTPNDAPQAAAAPAFEVVSVRQNVSGTGAPTTRIDGGRFVATNVPLQQLIADAYRMPIAGGPEWIGGARGPRRPGDIRFDVIATIPENAPAAQVPGMVQAMLAQRFNLAVHRETREQPAYVLVHARDDKRLGPQLIPSTQQCQAEIEGGPLRAPVGRVTEDGKPVCSIMMGPARIRGGGLTLQFLANAMGGFAGRPVVDRTGLQGPFDFDLQYAPAGRGAPPDDNRPSIFTAVQEQLGLELRPSIEPFEVLVIDRVSMPTEN